MISRLSSRVLYFLSVYIFSTLSLSGKEVLSFPQQNKLPLTSIPTNAVAVVINDKCCHFQQNVPQHYYLFTQVSSGYNTPVAQSVENRAAMREVVSSTPAGPTCRVLK